MGDTASYLRANEIALDCRGLAAVGVLYRALGLFSVRTAAGLCVPLLTWLVETNQSCWVGSSGNGWRFGS